MYTYLYMELKNKKRKMNRKTLGRICFSAFLLCVFVGMLSRTWFSGYSIRKDQTSDPYWHTQWVLESEEGLVNDEITTPYFTKLKANTLYTMTSVIEYDGIHQDSPYGFIHMDHAYIQVRVGDEVVLSYMPDDVDKWEHSKSPGFVYKEFPLPHDCLGKTIEVDILPMINSNLEYKLPEVVYGDFVSMLQFAFRQDISQNIIIVLCMVIGLLSIIFSTKLLSGSEYLEGVMIGVFSLLFGLYLMSETTVNAYYMGNPYYLYLINYITFSLLPIAMTGFLKERIPNRYKKVCNILIFLEIILFGLEMFLHFCGIQDLREMLPIIHFVYFFQILLCIYFIAAMKDIKKRRQFIFQLIPILTGMSLDAIIYWMHLNIGHNDATFTIIGVIAFLIIELLHVGQKGSRMYTDSIRSSVYRQMAYTDEMTGTKNRRSFEKEVSNLLKKDTKHPPMLLVSMDLNNLKYMNDHFGHGAGDLLIMSAAYIMMDIIQDKGSVYRIGGDEFFAFLYNVSTEEFQKMKQEAKQQIESFNANNDIQISIALGCVELKDQDILEAIKESDSKMYQRKIEMKKNMDTDKV